MRRYVAEYDGKILFINSIFQRQSLRKYSEEVEKLKLNWIIDGKLGNADDIRFKNGEMLERVFFYTSLVVYT